MPDEHKITEDNLKQNLQKEAESKQNFLRQEKLKLDEMALENARRTNSFKKHIEQQQTIREQQGLVAKHYREERQGGRGVHPQSTLYSAMMDAMPRFEALGRLVAAKTESYKLQAGKYLGDSGKALAKGMKLWGDPAYTSRVYNWLERKIQGEEPLDLPDLKYFTTLDDQGVLETKWVTDHVPHLFENDPEKMKSFQEELQTAFKDWIESVQDDDGHGFFIGSDARIYSKVHAIPISPAFGGGLMLDPNIVRERYEERYIEEDPNTHELKLLPNAIPKAGFEPLYINAATFESLRDNQAHPERSFDAFLMERYEHELEIEQTTRPSRGP